jgi:hypothetical protein
MVRVRLTHDDWQRWHADRHGVTIAGLERCLPWFGAA